MPKLLGNNTTKVPKNEVPSLGLFFLSSRSLLTLEIFHAESVKVPSLGLFCLSSRSILTLEIFQVQAYREKKGREKDDVEYMYVCVHIEVGSEIFGCVQGWLEVSQED